MKRKPASPAPSTPAQSEQTLPYTTTHDPFPEQHEWADHYTGGYSQWREEHPELWPNWQWPPYGWRPSQYQSAFWDENNPYRHYRYYDWDANPPPTTPQGKCPELRSPDTQSTLLSHSNSSLSEEVRDATEQLQRCTTAEQLTFQQRMCQAGEGTEHPTVETPADAGGGDQREGPTVETPGGGGEEGPPPEVPTEQNHVPPVGGNQEPLQQAAGGGNGPQNPNQPGAQPAGVGGLQRSPLNLSRRWR